MKKKTVALIASGIIVFLVLVYALTLVFDVIGIGGGDTPVDMRVSEGSTLAQIAVDLNGAGVIENELVFKLYAKTTGNGVYQMGMHSFTPSMTYKEIIAELEHMPEERTCKVTIPEGFEVWKVADKFAETGIINREVFMRELESGEFDFEFVKAIPQRGNRLEGYLYPDTYTFLGDESEHEIIEKMLKNFEDKVLPVYNQSDKSRSLDDVIKLASVIERESAGEAEHANIASVFVNRINTGMKLESCATVQYILKERKPVLSNEDTLIDSPYNTYMYSGLPVGPIASPGLAAIEAAIHPAETEYMYFLANKDGSGSIFSVTYEEHMQRQKEVQ